MLSPLKPLLCRHDFYWSERHGADRCRRCGKRQAPEPADILTGEPLATASPPLPVAATPLALDALPAFTPAGGVLIDFETPRSRHPPRSPETVRPSAQMLKTGAQHRRERLLTLLDRLVEGGRPTREEALDAVLAVIEDAHSADPVLFGTEAAGHFARLHEARGRRGC